MPVEIVSPVDVADLDGWLRTVATTLLSDVDDVERARMVGSFERAWSQYRSWGARDAGRWVATLATERRTLTVPDTGSGTRDLDADALTAVTVAGTHRRRGLLSAMLGRSLQAAKDRGDALSILVAAEWPIYGRFGYAPATVSAIQRLHPRRPGAVIVGADTRSVRQVDAAELGTLGAGVFDAARRVRAGQVDRAQGWWDRLLGLAGHPAPADRQQVWIVHDGPDGVDGLLGWRHVRSWDLRRNLAIIDVGDLVTANDTAYRDLWAYVTDMDLVEEVTLRDRPIDEPVRWLFTDGRALEQTAAYDFLWLRLLDVPAALAARGYAVDGELVLDVVDPDGAGFGAGRVALRQSDGTVECAATSAPADLRLSQRALASLYLGGHTLRQRRVVGDIEELRPGAVARADVMFSAPLPPWCQTGF